MRRTLNISYQCHTRNGNGAYPDGIVTCETNRRTKRKLEVSFKETFEYVVIHTCNLCRPALSMTEGVVAAPRADDFMMGVEMYRSRTVDGAALRDLYGDACRGWKLAKLIIGAPSPLPKS